MDDFSVSNNSSIELCRRGQLFKLWQIVNFKKTVEMVLLSVIYRKRRIKKKQRVKFEGSSNRIPSWRTPGLKREWMENEAESSTSSTSSTKRVKNDTDNNFYIEALSNEMRIRLTNKIRTCLDNEDDINTLKTQCLNATRLERGTVTTAEQKANVPATTIEKKRKGKEKEVEKEIVSDDTIPLNKVLDTSSSNHNTDEVRAFTTSITKIFRKDLPKDILHQFLAIISKTLVESTDYITTYGVQLFKMLIQFKDKRFELDEANNVVLSSIQVSKLKEYLPSDFNVDQPNQCLPPAPDRDFMNSDSFNKQLKSLFDTSHLQLIQSTYFGSRGPTQSTLQKSPLHKVSVDHIPPKNDQRQSLDVYIMKQALVKYTVNFISLWDNPKRLNNLLNRLLRVLLKIHLAPIREKKN
ncbi:hypothetical protein EDC94DRAFT_680372 [Helicostylum pulchrum]|nr:hypothetical protein EDC94DRAFT_680372 [Helicostylum pulchrum]